MHSNREYLPYILLPLSGLITVFYGSLPLLAYHLADPTTNEVLENRIKFIVTLICVASFILFTLDLFAVFVWKQKKPIFLRAIRVLSWMNLLFVAALTLYALPFPFQSFPVCLASLILPIFLVWNLAVVSDACEEEFL